MNASKPEPETKGAIIALGDPASKSVHPSVLDAHGGFLWWYVDALDENGDGAVIIWSFGLPFLPGYLSAARSGSGQPARQRPSLNVALYQGGRRSFYLLQEYGPDGARLEEQGKATFGSTEIDYPAEGELRLRIDCALARTRDRLRGEIRVLGPPARLDAGLSPSPDLAHRWAPVFGPSRAVGTLSLGGSTFSLDAPAYHDKNEGTRRFDDLGILHWAWGRLAVEGRTALWYLCYSKDGPPVAWGVELEKDGLVRVVRDLEPVLEGPRPGLFGVRTWQRVRLVEARGRDWLAADIGRRVDDGPFYARTLARVRSGSDEGAGVGEWIVPDRIDLARHRPLVRMAVHDLTRTNSFWLPLFSGPRRGRMARLLGLGRGSAVDVGETP